MDDTEQFDNLDFDAERLREDLGALYAADLDVPADVDAAVVGMAQRRFVRQRRSRLVLRTITVGAAAASIVLAVFVSRGWDGREAASPTMAVSDAPGPGRDIDGNGRVDIRDAFLLARRLEADPPTESHWDANGDGRVDRRDVDALAMAAVTLDGGTIQ
jgi:hypothetical protein